MSQISVNMSAEYQLICQSKSVGRVLIDMLADILADSLSREGTYVSWEVFKLHNIWEVAIVKRFNHP